MILFPQVKFFPFFVSAIKHIFRFVSVSINSITCGNKDSKYVYLQKQKLKVFILAETKSKILFCLGKPKIFSLAWENNHRNIYTCGNKAKDFLLLVKTKTNILF